MYHPEDFATAADYVAAVKALPDPPAHPDDPAMADEHAALFALVPRNQATHVAIKNGSWFDPSTWADGKIPDAHAKVLIPEAITVSYDGESDASLFTVRVDGKLQFAPDHNTRMVVDTLVVAKTGTLQIGTADHPIQDGIKADIVIADNGPIDVKWDPLLLSRGVISHGTTDIHGQTKDSFLKLALDPVAGSTVLHFDDNVSSAGWHVGDKIVIAGTHVAPKFVQGVGWVDMGTQDEVRTIKAIHGDAISLDSPLEFKHDSPRPDLKAYVADYTRNVVIETQNAAGVPTSQRGHVMFMHSPAVDVEYAELNELGRTDKSVRAVDAETTKNIASDTNVKGRYALHLHETGVDPGGEQAVIKGNAVWGSPGWGIVQHSSNADIENNATFDTFGAGYVAEAGNEAGVWHNNIAIGAHGTGFGSFMDKDANDVRAFDLARTGVGFYFQGRMIKATDNVAADVNQGFVYMVRGAPAEIQAGDLDQPGILHGLETGGASKAPILNFDGNEVFAAQDGLVVVKANPAQNHDVRSVVSNFTAWETDTGIDLSYTAHYTFLNTDLVGPQHGRTGPLGTAGVELGNNTFDIVLNGANIADYKDGIVLTKTLVGDAKAAFKGSSFNYVFIDLKTSGLSDVPIKNFDPGKDKLLTSVDLHSGSPSLQMAWHTLPLWSFDWPNGRAVALNGTKTDSIGAISYANGTETFTIDQKDMSGLLSHEGYYTTNDGRKVVVLDEYFSDRATGEIFQTSIPIQLANNVPLVKTPWFLPDGDARYLGSIDLNAPPPVAHADHASALAAHSVVINVLGNDSDPRGLPMSVNGLTQPVHGHVQLNENGTLTYTSDADFNGVEKFKYWVTDHNAKLSEGIVTVQVSGTGGSSGSDLPSSPSSPDGAGGKSDHPADHLDLPASSSIDSSGNPHVRAPSAPGTLLPTGSPLKALGTAEHGPDVSSNGAPHLLPSLDGRTNAVTGDALLHALNTGTSFERGGAPTDVHVSPPAAALANALAQIDSQMRVQAAPEAGAPLSFATGAANSKTLVTPLIDESLSHDLGLHRDYWYFHG